jgi:hypothetical protein
MDAVGLLVLIPYASTTVIYGFMVVRPEASYELYDSKSAPLCQFNKLGIHNVQ